LHKMSCINSPGKHIAGRIKNPEKWLIILGSLIIFLVIANFFFINILYGGIPEYIGEMSTGRNQTGLLQINIFIGIFAFWGFYRSRS
ncbi:MAG: hypothetical protein JW770_07805, partial [Actinobacteria bacterium]|nr:hypothetical protein [Actinomycetota bacterium]